MGDLDYGPHPRLSLDSCPTNNNDASEAAPQDNKGEKDGEESFVQKPSTLSVKIPKSRGSESPTVQTPISELKSRTQSWYYSSMYPGYKARRKEFKDTFSQRQISSNSKFVVDYSCAYHKDILHQGRLYVTTGSCCFYSYIFGWENKFIIDWSQVVSITKEKTAIFIPNAIQISTADSKFFFASFVDRDSSYMMLVRLWQAVTSNKLLSDEDIDQIIACEYGEGEDDEGVEEDSVIEDEAITAADPKVNDDNVNIWLRESEGSLVIDKTFSRPVSELFKLLYSNDNFYFNFQKERGTTELEIGDWEKRNEEVGKVREVSYNMELNNPVGPKKCQVKETQVLRELSGGSSKIYCIDTEADNSGVPYADSFSVLTHNCLVENGPGSSRLIAKAEIKFKKELWGFLKDKIETNAWSGIRNYYNSLSGSLVSYSESEPQQARLQSKQRPKPGSDAANQQSKSIFQSWLISTIMIILMMTSVLNTIILYRLSIISANTNSPSSNIQSAPTRYKLPDNQLDWLDLVSKQQQIHQVRVDFLRQQVEAAGNHIAAAETALDNIKNTLDGWQPWDWIDEEHAPCDEDNRACDAKPIETLQDEL